jgi:hypothetical protein
VVLAVSTSSDPHYPTKKEGRGVRLQLLGNRERREDEPQESATGVSEARSHQRRGKKTPTLVTLQETWS